MRWFKQKSRKVNCSMNECMEIDNNYVILYRTFRILLHFSIPYKKINVNILDLRCTYWFAVISHLKKMTFAVFTTTLITYLQSKKKVDVICGFSETRTLSFWFIIHKRVFQNVYSFKNVKLFKNGTFVI